MTQLTTSLLVRWFHSPRLGGERRLRLLEQPARYLVCDGNHIVAQFSNDIAGRACAHKSYHDLVEVLEESPNYLPGRA